MSTRATIVYADRETDTGMEFHLYHECFDDENVYLELEGQEIEYEASRNRVMVKIPNEVWETIRGFQGMSFEWADWTDDEVRDYATQKITERMERIREAEKDGKNSIARVLGVLTYGSADNPVEEQIERTYKEFLKSRDYQRQVRGYVQRTAQEGRGGLFAVQFQKDGTDGIKVTKERISD